ncbi:MAG TPA: GNAT family N-acetyltransferase [Pirellulales bacterium]|nr:GNAT family N-acetyltransferase [Pirellulales bacterium]
MCDEEHQVVAIAPWYRIVSRSGAKLIRFLGDGQVCSDYLTMLCRSGQEQAVATALADWLMLRNQRSAFHYNLTTDERCQAYPQGTNSRQIFASDCRWDRMEFVGIADNDVPIYHLVEQLEVRGNMVSSESAMNLWRVPLPPSWEEFLMILSKSHRNRLRRADKIYFQSGLVHLHRATAPNQIADFFDIFIDLHQRNWQRRGFPGCFASSTFETFLREVATRLLADGQITLTWLEMDGKPLAAEYRLHGDKVMYAYQSGMDPDRLQIRPGELANMASIRNAIELGQNAYDFLRGDEEYKARWRAEPHPMLSIRVVPQHVSARLRHNAWRAKQNLKQWIKSGLQLTSHWIPSLTTQE